MRSDGGPRAASATPAALDLRRPAGLSLVEASIMLAVLALLSAAIAPSISNYLGDARTARARKDVEVIGTALMRMLDDVGETFVLRDGNGAAATDVPSRAAGNRVDLLVSSGAIPAVAVARASGTPDWDAALNNTTVGSLADHVTLNTPSGVAANRYRVPADMSVLANFDPDDGATTNAPHAWRGAYLPASLGADPWGRRYAVNVEFLARAPGGVSGNVNDVLVISAGSDARISTRFDTDGVAAGGDDIIYTLFSSTR